MKYYARTDKKSYLNNNKGENWQEVTFITKRFPSGLQECVVFADGFIVPKRFCEIEVF